MNLTAMKFFNLLSIATGLRISNTKYTNDANPYTVVRFDRESPFSDTKFYSIHEASKRVENTINKEVLSPADAFKVNLTCTAGDAEICLKVEKAIKSAGELLLANLLITRQVVLKATYKSFCEGQELSTCPGRRIVSILNSWVGHKRLQSL